MNIDLLRTKEESLPPKDKCKLFLGHSGALRFVTYIENFHSTESYLSYIKEVSPNEFEELQNYYLKDCLLRPYSRVFKKTIGDLTHIDFWKCPRFKSTLKKIAYNDVLDFLSFIKKDKSLKEHYSRLFEY